MEAQHGNANESPDPKSGLSIKGLSLAVEVCVPRAPRGSAPLQAWSITAFIWPLLARVHNEGCDARSPLDRPIPIRSENEFSLSIS